MSLPPLVGLSQIQQAAANIAQYARKTPVLNLPQVDEQLGIRLFLKCENLQLVGAFKFRGAYHALAQLDPAQRAHGVVAYSSGNHAQAVALAAKLFGVPATIVMPQDAPRIKTEKVRLYGAKIVSYDRLQQDREQIAQQLAQSLGATIIPPFAHPDIIAGQGTVGLELFEQVPGLDQLYVPLGGGGLLSGVLAAQQALAPQCQVFGVEPQAGNDGQMSLAQGEIVSIAPPQSIADGALTQALAPITFAHIQQYARGILTVDDDALIKALRFVAEQFKLVVEPTGVLGLAAVLQQLPQLKGQQVGVVLSGGNIDLTRLGQFLAAQANGPAGTQTDLG